MSAKAWAMTLLVMIAPATPAVATDLAAERDQARSLIKQLGGALKSELQAAMKNGGPTEAISVCNQRAPKIAAKVSADTPWRVGRTSLRIRNPANRPDAWEAGVLTRFDQRLAAGEPAGSIDHLEVIEADGRRELRYVKAIPTAELCTTCHGTNLDPAVSARLDELYPEDRARGYSPGQLRGAFTLRKPLDIGY